MPMPEIGRAGREEFGQRWPAETGDDGRFASPGSLRSAGRDVRKGSVNQVGHAAGGLSTRISTGRALSAADRPLLTNFGFKLSLPSGRFLGGAVSRSASRRGRSRVANCPPRLLIPVVAVNLAIQNHGLVSGGKIGAVAN